VQLEISTLADRYGKSVDGIVHVGANDGQELPDYLDAGVAQVRLFEPLAEPYARLTDRVAKTSPNDRIEIFNVALGSEPATADMFVADNQGASSSLLEPEENLRVWKRIAIDGAETVEVRCLDDYMAEGDPHNLLILDVQGFELEVLKGAGTCLENFDYILCELNIKKSYKGSAGVEDIDTFMSGAGYLRVETYWMSRYWGDGLYVKRSMVADGVAPKEIHFKKPRSRAKQFFYSLIGRA